MLERLDRWVARLQSGQVRRSPSSPWWGEGVIIDRWHDNYFKAVERADARLEARRVNNRNKRIHRIQREKRMGATTKTPRNMKRRQAERALSNAGFSKKGQAKHIKWVSPDGLDVVVLGTSSRCAPAAAEDVHRAIRRSNARLAGRAAGVTGAQALAYLAAIAERPGLRARDYADMVDAPRNGASTVLRRIAAKTKLIGRTEDALWKCEPGPAPLGADAIARIRESVTGAPLPPEPEPEEEPEEEVPVAQPDPIPQSALVTIEVPGMLEQLRLAEARALTDLAEARQLMTEIATRLDKVRATIKKFESIQQTLDEAADLLSSI